ncbi:MAG: hypothetical protein ACYS0E_05140 [Planctomycetota bacterium]|jgi:hypothetical protein
MRQFLPIKGPGGRALTLKEKVALVVLAVTLILCVLTLLAGDDAFGPEPARNPVFAFVGILARSVGVGIIGLYAIVMLWSGLIFFKGERVAGDKPMPGRAMAAIGIAIGISGMLGLAQLDAAGVLGSLVGGAIGNAFGAVFGFALLLAMLVLGGHLAGQGAWSALRGPIALAAAAPVAPATGGFTLPEQSPRVGATEYLPDDGDPSADERTRAIALAMDEIERSQGVTIVEVEERPSIGEEVEEAPEPETHTEEAQVQAALDDVAATLSGLHQQEEEVEEEEPEVDEIEAEDEDEELEEEEEVEAEEAEWDDEAETEAEEEEEFEEEDVEAEEAEWNDEAETEAEEEEELEEEEEDELEDEEEEFEEEEEEDEDDSELDEEEYEGEDEDDEEWDDEAEVEEEEEDEEDELESTPDSGSGITQPYLFPVARREVDEQDGAEDSSDEEEDLADEDEPAPSEAAVDDTNFDWRGRPLA